MIITAWVLLFFFGSFAVHGLLKFFLGSLNRFHATLWFVSIIITAIASGMLWGGLFQDPQTFVPAYIPNFLK